ncbi:MAG: hypothetical protein ACTSYB_07540 [Candidatus Helarchaeota archaeon]
MQQENIFESESYIKTIRQGITIYIQTDAYFILNGLDKITIDCIHTNYGKFLAIYELMPQISDATTNK